MITIKCDKCGKASDNSYMFAEKRFSYVTHDGARARFIHLCAGCQETLQKTLQEMTDKAIADFLDVPRIRQWTSHNGIVT